LIAASIVRALANGISDVISNSLFDVIPHPTLPSRPELTRAVVPELKRPWESIYAFFLQFLNTTASDRLIMLLLSLFIRLILPRTRTASANDAIINEINTARLIGAIAPSADLIPFEFVVLRAAHYYLQVRMFSAGEFTQQISELISRAITCLSHDRKEVRFAIQHVALSYKAHVAPFYRAAYDAFTAPNANNPTVLGNATFLTWINHIRLTRDGLEVIRDTAIELCGPYPPDVPEGAPRGLRQAMSTTIDDFDWRPGTVDILKEISRGVMDKLGSDYFSQAYGCSIAAGNVQSAPDFLAFPVVDFLTGLLIRRTREYGEQAMGILELPLAYLLPRVPKRPRVRVEKVTPENYDDAEFVDGELPKGSQTEVLFLSNEELSDPTILSRYFQNVEAHVAIFKMLADRFIGQEGMLYEFSRALVREELVDESHVSRRRVHFWNSLVRVPGVDFALS
jgi:hypothetical protein